MRRLVRSSVRERRRLVQEVPGLVDPLSFLLPSYAGAKPSRAATSAGLAAYDLLASEGYDPAFGARPLRRLLQRELENPLAVKLLAGELHEGDTVRVDVTDGALAIEAA